MVIAKHDSNFFESEVMIELNRQATAKGHYEPTPEETVLAAVAAATAVKPSLAPSKDLHEDIIRLASGLRKKGYEAEAKEVEQSFLLYKSAQSLYDVHGESGEDFLEFAHPDADVEIAPSSNEYGKVEDLISTHKKILEMIKKAPTGKYAMSEAAAIVKGAQVGIDPQKKSTQDGVQLNKARKNLIESLRATERGQDGELFFKFTEQRLMSGDENLLAQYQVYSGANAANVKDYAERSNFYFGTETPQQHILVRNIMNFKDQSGIPELKKYVKFAELTAGEFDKHLHGIQPGFLKVFRDIVTWNPLYKGVDMAAKALGFGADELIENSDSIFGITPIGGSEITQAGATKLAAAMFNRLGGRRKAAFGPALIKANASVKSFITDFDDSFRNINLEPGSLPEKDKELLDYLVANVQPPLQKYGPNAPEFTKLVQLMTGLGIGAQGIGTAMSNFVKVYNKMYTEASKDDPTRAIVGDVRATVAAFDGAKDIYTKYLSTLKDGDKRTQALKDNIESSKELSILSNFARDKSYSVVFNKIKDVFPDLDTWEKFNKFSKTWMADANTETGISLQDTEKPKPAVEPKVTPVAEPKVTPVEPKVTPKVTPADPINVASRKNDIVKEAAIKAKQPVNSKPVASGRGGQSATRGRGEAIPGEMEVQAMQNAMKRLANAAINYRGEDGKESGVTDVEAASFHNTGLRGDQTDGKWGDKTNASLQAIQDKFAKLKLNIGSHFRKNTDGIDRKALANIKVLNVGIKFFGGEEVKVKGAKTDVIDSLHQYLNAGNIASTEPGGNELLTRHIGSLVNFYNYIESSAIKYGEEPKEGDVVASAVQEIALIKAAQEIKNNIVRNIPEWDKEVGAKPEGKEEGGLEFMQASSMNAGMFNSSIKWLVNRARNQRKVDATVENKRYLRDAESLYAQWKRIATKQKLKGNSSISVETLTRGGGARNTGSGGSSAGRGGSGEGYSSRREGKKTPTGPFKREMNIRRLLRDINTEFDERINRSAFHMDRYRDLLTASYDDLIGMVKPVANSTTGPEVIARKYLEDLKRYFNAAYERWVDEYYAVIGDSEAVNRDPYIQKREFNDWQKSLDRAIRKLSRPPRR